MPVSLAIAHVGITVSKFLSAKGFFREKEPKQICDSSHEIRSTAPSVGGTHCTYGATAQYMGRTKGAK